MFEKYYSLSEKCGELDNPTYEQLKEIQKEWDSYTLELFKNFDFNDIIDMWTLLNEEMSDEENYYNNFRGYLSYSSDRMNLNRWCRLQLLLGNAVNKAYSERSDEDE